MKQVEGQTAFVLEIVDSVLRSWWTIVAGLCLGVATALIALSFMPKIYEASTKIFVARQRIPESFVRSTVTDDIKLRMAALKEAVLSRPYLERIIEESYPPAPTGEELERKIREVRWKVNVVVSRGLFSITYRDSDPVRAADVANTLAQLYIDENANFRASRAGETTNTLESLAAKSREELLAKEQAIVEFKAKHPFETEEHRESNFRMREQFRRDLENNEDNRRYEERRLEDLRIQLLRAQGQGAPVLLPDDPLAVRLGVLRAELDDLLTHYRPSHPSVRAKQREIEELQLNRDAPRPSGSPDSVPAVSPAMLELQRNIANSEEQLRQLEVEKARLKRELARYDARLQVTPQVQSELAELTKGFAALRQRYEDYQSKVETAKGAQTIEEDRKGEQFEVIERAMPSAIPVEPRPKLVMAVCVVLGWTLFVGPIVLRHVLRPLIASETGLTGLSDLPLLVSIPALPTAEAKRKIRGRKSANWGFSFVAVALVLAAAIFLQR